MGRFVGAKRGGDELVAWSLTVKGASAGRSSRRARPRRGGWWQLLG